MHSTLQYVDAFKKLILFDPEYEAEIPHDRFVPYFYMV